MSVTDSQYFHDQVDIEDHFYPSSFTDRSKAQKQFIGATKIISFTLSIPFPIILQALVASEVGIKIPEIFLPYFDRLFDRLRIRYQSCAAIDLTTSRESQDRRKCRLSSRYARLLLRVRKITIHSTEHFLLGLS